MLENVDKNCDKSCSRRRPAQAALAVASPAGNWNWPFPCDCTRVVKTVRFL